MAKIPKKITNEIESANKVIHDISIVEITNNELLDQAIQFFDIASDKLKELEAKQKDILDPLRLGINNIKALFEQPINNLSGIIKELKPKIQAYLASQKENIPDQDVNRIQEIQLLLSSKDLLDLEIQDLVIEQQNLVNKTKDLSETHKDVISVRKLWKFKVTRIEDIPLQFMTTNDVFINKFIRETQGSMEVPGIEIYQEEIITKARS